MGKREVGPPKGGYWNKLRDALEGGASVVGGPLSKLIGWIPTGYDVRSQQFIEHLFRRIQRLEKKDAIIVERMTENEAFLSCLARATSSAARTSTGHKDKLKALQNTVLNSVGPTAPER